MATWNLSPQYKKSAVEKMFFYKDGMIISIEQGFRWANFTVESDERPLTDEELKNEDGYELGCIDNDECWEMSDMTDGCWLDIARENDKVTDEEFDAFEAAWEEDGYNGVEDIGWSNDDTEYYYYGPLELTNEDTGEVFQGEPDENVSVSGVPHVTNTSNPIDFPTQVKDFVDGYAERLENMSDEEWENLDEDSFDWTPIEEEKPVVTDWYPASIKPARTGAYQILQEENETKWPFSSNIMRAEWNGKKWDKDVVKWRGLNEDPNEV